MTAEEYFGDWIEVIDKEELFRIMRWLKTVDQSNLCPAPKNIFKAFHLCPYKECRVVMLGQDPYPQRGVATGILFGNSPDTPEEALSPSLQVVKEAAINYEIPRTTPVLFDNTLESWAKQGILMINTALTCEVNRVGSHFNIWKPFISKLIYNISKRNNGLIFVLFGNQASMFKSDIVNSLATIEVYHPAYFARRGEKMPYNIFLDINRRLYDVYGEKIEFYKETEYGTC